MRVYYILGLLIFYCLIISCNHPSKISENEIKNQVQVVLNESVTAWNEGNIEKYMACYLKSDSLRFAGNGEINFGWQTVLERYKKGYPDQATMGCLTFSETDISVLSESYALVFGRWHLKRENDEPNGLFTLLIKNTENGWRIVHDHSSSTR
ncbi:nuclear transport factor 2 family protein [candidate division KSB1 bacterium]|nr:nuclear transport factor 2 family protein [candidate division KSB1 bacterium]